MSKADVSACLVVRDAQSSLSRCLQSISDLVNELIIVDTGSCDATKSQAESLGYRVYDFPWTDDFSAARNESLRRATARWILWLDADEYVGELNRQKLQGLFANLKEDAAYVMTQRSMLQDGGQLDLQHTRLFRNHPEIRWQFRVHEQITPSIQRLGHPIRSTDIVIQHSGYEDANLRHRKIERNARLLEQDLAQRGNDAYLIYNLATAYGELGPTAEAIQLLQKSLELPHPGYSTLRDAYTALLQCHLQLGQPQEAWDACCEGRSRYPDDLPLLFWQGRLMREQGDFAGAETCLLQVIQKEPGPYIGVHDAVIRKCLAPHFLGMVYSDQGRLKQAEAQWLAALGEQPDHKPSWQQLAELYIRQQRWGDLEPIVARFQAKAEWVIEGAVFRARCHYAQGDFAAARVVLEQAIAQAPHVATLRFYLASVLLQEGKDLSAAESIFRELLKAVPSHADSWRNLVTLLLRQNRTAEALAVCKAGISHCPKDIFLQQTSDSLAAR